MRYVTKNEIIAIQFDGDNHYVLLDLYTEHAIKKSAPWMYVGWIDGKKKTQLGDHKMKKGEWLVIDEFKYPNVFTNKDFHRAYTPAAGEPTIKPRKKTKKVSRKK